MVPVAATCAPSDVGTVPSLFDTVCKVSVKFSSGSTAASPLIRIVTVAEALARRYRPVECERHSGRAIEIRRVGCSRGQLAGEADVPGGAAGTLNNKGEGRGTCVAFRVGDGD